MITVRVLGSMSATEKSLREIQTKMKKDEIHTLMFFTEHTEVLSWKKNFSNFVRNNKMACASLKAVIVFGFSVVSTNDKIQPLSIFNKIFIINDIFIYF